MNLTMQQHMIQINVENAMSIALVSWRDCETNSVNIHKFQNPPVAILGGFFIELKWKCGT